MKAKLINKALAWLMTLTMVVSMLPVSVFAADGNVAKVGNTEYATIDEAIANWTNGTTLTLLDDVTLSDVVKLSSTEYHILDLGTYTMTAASGKDAIQYVVNGRSSASYALDIKADATNPGGITAKGKAIVSHIKPSSNAPSKDRPITRFYGGVFNASYVVKQGGTGLFAPGAGYTGASAPYFQFYGGEYNGTIYTNRSQNQFYGGTFNGSMQMSVDSSAYTLIAGGTFKNLSNTMGSALNSDKFVIGTAKGANDGSVCIDENGNYVVTTTTPAAAEASVASNYNSNNYFYYSTVNTSGMYYEDVYDALEANTTGEVTVFTDELDMTQVADFTGTIVVPEGETVTITVAEGTTPTWEVSGAEDAVTYVDENNTVLEKSEDGSFVAPTLTLSDFVEAVIAANGNYDGRGATFVITPASGDARTETVEGLPNRLQNYSNPEVYYAQYQRFSELTDVSISNVNFEFVPAAVTVVDPWNTAGATTTVNDINGELQLMNAGSVTLTGCTFDKMSVSPINATSVIVSDCEFSGLSAYAIKDIKASTVSVTGSTFTDCSGAFWMSTAPATLTVTGNDFVNVGRRGAIQFSANGDYTNTAMNVTGNEVTGGAFLWQLNPTVTYEQVSAILDATKNTYETAYVDNSIEPAAPAYVAEVNGVEYTDLQEAIVAAAPSGTVELLSDVTVDKWVMISETLSIGSGQIITLDMDGLTIDGNGYTLTVNAIESATNGNHLIYDGDYNVQDLTIEVADGVRGGLGITSGTISNVTFVGGNVGVILSDGVVTGVHAGDVTIEGCTFKVDGSAIYYESAQDGLVVNDNTFEIPSTANVIVMYGAEKFTNNTVVSGRTVNVAGGSPVVTGNDFGDVRFKVYNDATATIENNTINNLVFNDETVAQSAFTNNTLSESAQTALEAVTAPAVTYVAEVNGVKYATLSEAFAAVASDNDTITILSDVTENLTGAYLRGNIVAEEDVTITLTNADWVYLPYTFVVGENVILKAPALFYYAGGAQINGTVITDAYYQRYAGAKLTINEPGSMTVTSEMFYLRYTDGDPNAGIYVVGDNNDETIGLNTSVIYFYQGMINAKDANIKTAVYWQTNETDGQGSANLVLDNTKMDVTVNESNFKATGNSTVTLKNGSVLTCAGGFEAAEDGLSVQDTSKIIYNGGTITAPAGLAGAGTEADPYLIKSIEDLILFRDSVNAGETKYNAAGVYVALDADIDMAGINWIGIGSIAQPHGFMGNFDGKGFKIKNLTITDPTLDSDGYAYAGLFSITEGADANNQNVIKNLTIENVTISTTGHIVSAAIAYPYYTIVDNVTVCGDINIVGGDYTAGALAYTRRCVNASNVTVSGNVGSTITGAQVVGGVISDIQMNGGLTAAYSNFSAESLTINGTKNVGGISGIIASQTLDGATVKNVVINGADTRVGIVSGVLGGVSTIKNVVSENVTGATAIIGGTYDAGAAVEAKIGNTYYATLDDALAAAQTGETVELLADIEVTATVKVLAGKTLTLDLNGKAIDGTGNVRIALATYGNLTVKDSSAEQTGIIKAGIGTAGNTVNVCGGTFTLESGSIYSLNNAILIDENASDVFIKGGKITAEPTTNNSAVMYVSGTNQNNITITGGEMVGYNGILLWNNTAIEMTGGSIEGQGTEGVGIQGNGSRDNTTITLSGGSVTGGEVGIYHPQGGTLAISGDAAISGGTGIVVKGGNVTISSGTINGTGAAGAYAPVGSGFKSTGDALYVEHYDNSTNSENYGTPVVTVTGGTFNSANGSPVASYANANNAANGVAALERFVSGGTFNKEPAVELAAEGYEFAANDDGTYGVVEAVTELFTLAGITTSLDSSLALNIYYTPLSGATATDYYAVVAHQKEDAVAETTIPYADWGTSGGKKLIRYTGLAAKEMADELTVTIYDAEGNAVSKSFTTSFRAYAIGMMSSGQYNPAEHRVWFTALTDMLNYGAAAQQMFGYKTDNLANAGTDKFQQYASAEYTLSTDGFSMSGTAWAPSLTLESTILLNFYFNDVTEGMYATYSYTTHAGTSVSATVDYNSFVNGWGHSGVAVPIAIADADTFVTVTMFNADGSVAGAMTCSANNYLKGMAENNPDVALYPALAKFAASAKAAFAN